MSHIKTLFLFQLQYFVKTIVVWSAVLFGIMSMYMAFFSTMQEMAQVKFEMLPKEYLQLMGVEDISQMGNYVTFFGMIFNILIIIMSIYAVTFSMNLILKEEKTKPLNICTLYLLPEKKFTFQKYWWLCVPFFLLCYPSELQELFLVLLPAVIPFLWWICLP